MKATEAEIEKYLATISETPGRIAQLAAGCDEAQLHFKADPKTWSASDILAHLRACADLWTHSIYAMLAEHEPAIPDIDERKWARVTRYAELPFHESLQAFSLQRGTLVRVLSDLSNESWERPASILGRRHTVFTQTRRLAEHEMVHIKQLKSVLRSDEM